MSLKDVPWPSNVKKRINILISMVNLLQSSTFLFTFKTTWKLESLRFPKNSFETLILEENNYIIILYHKSINMYNYYKSIKKNQCVDSFYVALNTVFS